MARITYLTLEDFEFICVELSSFFQKKKEPRPVFKESYFEKLESVIASPKHTFSKTDLYPDFFEKAACYFYFINKFHPFSNGNKRISIVATGVFLMYNGHEFTAGEDVMYRFAKKITVSQKKQKEEFKEVVDFVRDHSRRQNIYYGPKFIIDLIRIIQKRIGG